MMDDDFLIFDVPDEAAADPIPPEKEWAGKLIIPPRADTSDELNLWEDEFRRTSTTVLFEEEDEDGGPPFLGNPQVMARAMGLAPGTEPDLAAALEWLERQ